jgi:hypothetical protein
MFSRVDEIGCHSVSSSGHCRQDSAVRQFAAPTRIARQYHSKTSPILSNAVMDTLPCRSRRRAPTTVQMLREREKKPK